MFTSKEQLIKRTGKNSIGRYDFLKLLATEFKTTKSREAKEQVLANLANFAYDPINYGYIRQLEIIDLFLHTLSEDNLKLVRFAIGGVCNVCVENMYPVFLLSIFYFLSALADNQIKTKALNNTVKVLTAEPLSGCVCGIFLSGQFKKGSKEPPKGNPALIHDLPGTFPCTTIGNRLCTNKCLDTIIKYLPNSQQILCSSIEYDCHKERAYLFIKNCKSRWINTNLSTGREYCCKNGTPYKCPAY